MPVINKSALVPFSADQIYTIVNDVERYPEFVDGCQATRIIEQSGHHMIAELTITKKGFSQSFITQNRLTPGKVIELELKDGPFEYLKGKWSFEELDESACKVSFLLDFKFSNKLMALTLNSAFKQIAESMMSAFIQRAKDLNGS